MYLCYEARKYLLCYLPTGDLYIDYVHIYET